jgi:hypothetical protein
MKGYHVNIKHFLTGAVLALGLSLTAQAASAGALAQDAPALNEQGQGTVTLVKGGHHWHSGRFWWGVPFVAAPIVYGGSCYAHCREYRGPRYCHAYCGY